LKLALGRERPQVNSGGAGTCSKKNAKPSWPIEAAVLPFMHEHFPVDILKVNPHLHVVRAVTNLAVQGCCHNVRPECHPGRTLADRSIRRHWRLSNEAINRNDGNLAPDPVRDGPAPAHPSVAECPVI
jgi:hypothetical protein